MTSPGARTAVVVGAGMAGLAAAIRLGELGIDVRLLEAREEERYPNNTRYGGGVLHVAFRSVFEKPETLVEAVLERTSGFVRLPLARALAGNSARAIGWLKGQGVAVAAMPNDEGWKDCVLAPLGFHDGTRLTWRDFGSDQMMQVLEKRLNALGIRIERGVRAVELIERGDGCGGVVAERAGERLSLEADAVVLADGGFQASHEMMRRHFAAAPDRLIQRGPGISTGDGIALGTRLGADLVGMEAFYGHVLSADALHDDNLWPFPFLDFVAGAGMLLDGSALRFVDEGLGGVYMANAIARHRDQRPVFAIFDQAIWDEAGRHFFAPPNPNLERAGGTLYRAEDLTTLAGLAGLPADALETAVETHNRAVAAGTLSTLSPERTDPKSTARPIIAAPFYAAPGRAAITHTMGGLRIDERARVLRPSGEAIPGLFAAGNVTGGFEGGPTIGYIGGLARALVFALLGAEQIARKDQPVTT